MTDHQILPWHRPHWTLLESALQRNQLHHALLIHGMRGLGKQLFVQRLVAMLLCDAAGPVLQRPCCVCRGCRLLTAGSHPDSLILAPEEGKTLISVDQVRGLISENILTSHYNNYRVTLLSPAHTLSISAANALLKSLEEPPDRHLFVLVTDHPTGLPVTLRSRCLSLLFSPPGAKEASDWLVNESSLKADWPFLLDWTGGAPLAALEAATRGDFSAIESSLKTIADLLHGRIEPVTVADHWRKSGLNDNLIWQLRLLAHLMRNTTTGPSSASLPVIQEIAGKLNLPAMNRVYDEVMELRDAVMRNLNPNERLTLEGLAVTWQLASGRGPAPH